MGRARRIQSISPGDKQARCLWISSRSAMERRKLNRMEFAERKEGTTGAARIKRCGMPSSQRCRRAIVASVSTGCR